MRRTAIGQRCRRLIDAVMRLVDAAMRLATAPVDMLVAMSPALRVEAQSVFPASRLAQIAEPVLDAGQWTRRPQPPRRREAPLLLFAGRLAPPTDPMTAIQPLAALPPTPRPPPVWPADRPLPPQPN